LVEPQSSALAKLCVYCIFSSLEYNNNNPQQINSRKRTRKDIDTEDIDLGIPAAKILRLNETNESNPIFNSSSSQTQGMINGQKCIILREPLLNALNGLFSNFNYLAGRNGEVSQHTHFILQFLQLTVQCGKDRARVILQKMPQSLVKFLY
jgi:mediator of RNA polymerase II transcription subunit 24